MAWPKIKPDMRRLYRRQLVRAAGRADKKIQPARPGVTYLDAGGVRIPRSFRHLIDRRFLP